MGATISERMPERLGECKMVNTLGKIHPWAGNVAFIVIMYDSS